MRNRHHGAMSIRAKTTVFVVIALGVLTALMATVQFRTSLNRVEQIENDRAIDHAQRVIRQIDNSQVDLGGTNADWAWWDDSYEFIENNDDDFRDSNLYAEAFVPLGVDLFVFIDGDGAVVADAWYADGEEQSVPDEIIDLGQPGAPLGDFADDPQATPGGLVKAGDDMFLVTSRAILPSEMTGSPRGVLVMGRYVGENFVAELGELVNLDLSVEPCTGRICEGLSGDPLIAKSPDVVSTSTALAAIDGSPALRAEISAPRTMYKESLDGIQRTLVILIAVGLFAVVFTVAGLRRLIIEPLERLGSTVAEVARTNDPSLRAPVSRTDEIGELAGGVNVMLARLENSQRQLVEAKAKVEGASEAKSRFLSRVSHELRTPINGVLAYAQLLQLDHPDGESRESVDQIITSARHITALVDEFLDIARIEAGAIPITIETISPAAITKEVIDMAQPLAHARGTTVELTGPHDALALADPVRLRQSVLNLVSNAIKYGPGDRPISVSITPQGSHTLIAVKDEGPGIPADQIDRLFIPFDRLDADKSDQKGSGVGLSVTKQLVELMHGTIDVESGSGIGTTFTITLPAPRNQTTSADSDDRGVKKMASRR